MTNFLVNFFMLSRTLIEGMGLFLAGIGFLMFDITSAAGNEIEDFNPFTHIKGLIIAGIVFIGFGIPLVLLDGDYINGLIHILAGVSIIIHIVAWRNDFRILTIISALLISSSFIGLSVISVSVIGITIINISYIIFGISILIFQTGAQIDKAPLLVVGSIALFCGTTLIGNIFIINGVTKVVIFIINIIFNSTTENIINYDNISFVEAIGHFLSGIGIFGIMIGLFCGGHSGKNKDKNIILGISIVILGIGFVGLSFIESVFSGNSSQEIMFSIFSIGIILGNVSGINLIKLGHGLLTNNLIKAGNIMFNVIFSFIGLFIQYIIINDYYWGIGTISFIVTFLLCLFFNTNKKAMRIIFPFYVMSSLFYGGIYLYTGLHIFFQ